MVKHESERLHSLLQQLKELSAQIQQEQARISGQQGREDTQRALIAGRVVLSHADEDQRFRTQLHDLLERYVTTDEERALFGLESRPAVGREQAEVQPIAPDGEEDPGADPDLGSTPRK